MAQQKSKAVHLVRINLKALAAVAVLIVVGVAGVVALKVHQDRQESAAVLKTVEDLHKAGDLSLAIRHLNQHLSEHPADEDARYLKSKILYEAAKSPAQYPEAIKAHEQFLRMFPEAEDGELEKAPPRIQEVRRHLVELYVKYGEFHRTHASNQRDNMGAAMENRFHAAELVARQLIKGGDTDTGARRLLAMAMEGLAVPGDEKALKQAIDEYREVLAQDPTDIEASERLAKLYQERHKDLPRAERVLDELLRAQPRSTAVRLARYRLYARARRDKQAEAELEEALRLTPDDLSVILAAAEDALRRGDLAGARGQLDKVPAASRGDVRVLMTRGMIDFSSEQPEEAVDAWRQGLLASSGTNEEVTWWLAFSLLQMGRVSEAVPLISQYRRLTGETASLSRYLFLEALRDERNGKPLRAIAILDQLYQQLEPQWETMIQLARGRCYEALWDEMKALEAYTKATQLDPLAVVPRLSISKILMKRHPDDAVSEIQRGLKLIPGDPTLQVALVGALLRREITRPAPRRDWSEFDRALLTAAKTSPGSTAIVLLQADRLSLSGHEDDAIKLLEETSVKNPRNVSVVIALADGLNRQGQPARALKFLRRASAPDAVGDRASIRIALAQSLTALNHGREARAMLKRDVEKLPVSEQAQIWMSLGRLENAAGNVAEARRAFVRWKDLLPDDPRPRLVLLDLAIDQRDENSMKVLIDEIEGATKTPGGPIDDVSYRLAKAKRILWDRNLDKRSLEVAATLVDSTLADAPELPAALMMHGQVLEQKDRADEAINAYQRAWDRGIEAALPRLINLVVQTRRFDTLDRLRESHDGPKTQFDLLSAEALLKIGETSRASQAAGNVTQDLPRSAEASRWQARMLDHLGRIEDAETALRAVAERQTDALDPWLALIRFQAGKKRTEAVAATIKRVKEVIHTDLPDLLEARCQRAAGNMIAAREAFERVVASQPGEVLVLLEVASFYDEGRHPKESEATLREVLRINPKVRRAVRQLALIQARRSTTLAEWQDAWTTLGPETADAEPEDRFARGILLTLCPDPERRGSAIEALKELIADLPVTHPTAVAARTQLVTLLDAAGQSEESTQIKAVSASKSTDPASIALYAEALIQSKKPEAAEWQLDRLAAINPGDPREAGLRARVIWDRSRPVEAAAALENAYAIRESNPAGDRFGREAFLLLVGMGDEFFPAAERLGTKLARKNPAWSWMPGLVLARRGRNEQALALLQTAAESTSLEDLVETARTAMTIAIETDDAHTLEKVDTILVAALRSNPTSDELLIMTAMLRHLQGRYDEEVTLYKTALEHQPENPIILNNLAWVLSEGLHQPEDAMKFIDELFKSIKNAQTLDTRGMILLRLGRLDEAIRDFREVLVLAPSALGHIHLARVLYARAVQAETQKKEDEARESREEANTSLKKARQAGFSLKDIDPVERAEIQTLMRKLAD